MCVCSNIIKYFWTTFECLFRIEIYQAFHNFLDAIEYKRLREFYLEFSNRKLNTIQSIYFIKDDLDIQPTFILSTLFFDVGFNLSKAV